jgi:histone deacetylase 11
VGSTTSDSTYIELMRSNVILKLDELQPNFVIYNAGTDCLEGDPLGNMRLTEDGIARRDEMMFEECMKRGVPILMVLSGGY